MVWRGAVSCADVRYADGPATQVEVLIAAPPATVWRLVCDIDVPARFSTEFCGGIWVEGDGPGLGARFVGRNQHPMRGEWETTSTIVAFEPERLFGWAVGDVDNPSASWRFELEAQDGGTRLRQCVRLGPGPSGMTNLIAAMPDNEERIIERRLAEHLANMTATVEGIRALAQNSAAGRVAESRR
jgi:uncharacterized protein YndB with AHSA1/START domain